MKIPFSETKSTFVPLSDLSMIARQQFALSIASKYFSIQNQSIPTKQDIQKNKFMETCVGKIDSETRLGKDFICNIKHEKYRSKPKINDATRNLLGLHLIAHPLITALLTK